jgi:hypothetical protein
MALRGQEMFVPLTHPPGEAQADFGEALIVIAGIEHRAHYLAIDLPHPNGTAHPAGEVPSHHRTTLVKDLGIGSENRKGYYRVLYASLQRTTSLLVQGMGDKLCEGGPPKRLCPILCPCPFEIGHNWAHMSSNSRR